MDRWQVILQSWFKRPSNGESFECPLPNCQCKMSLILQALGTMLTENRSLRELSVRRNQFGDNGAKASSVLMCCTDEEKTPVDQVNW